MTCAVIFLAVLVGGAGAAVAQTAAKPGEISLPLTEKKPARTNVGDAACGSCHQEKAKSYHAGAHARTSSLASAATIHGSFNPGSNTLRTANPNLYFLMEAKESGFWQTAVARTSATEVMTRSEQIDIVVGSGRKGQTYLYWDGDALFQLPVSFWTEVNVWVNSPGYVDGTANFERPIAARCLECHASVFESHAPPENAYRRDSLVLGISCEKCHGPGSEHVALYRSASPPRTPAEAAIVNPARLVRDRQIDVCSLCHAGAGEPRAPALSFAPGDVLANHLEFAKQALGAPMDVHASQVQLLAQSRCFQSSPTMTCSTCHDVHQPQRGLAGFAARCATCHQVESCRVFPKLGHRIDQQCAVCHMPLQETALIVSAVNGQSLQPKVRNHRIAIYPEIHLP